MASMTLENNVVSRSWEPTAGNKRKVSSHHFPPNLNESKPPGL